MANHPRDQDFPTGRNYLRNHPLRHRLSDLIRDAAHEYNTAPKCEGFLNPDGDQVRSKKEIITDILNQLFPPGGDGMFVKMNENGEWVRNEVYYARNGATARSMVSSMLTKMSRREVIVAEVQSDQDDTIINEGEQDMVDMEIDEFFLYLLSFQMNSREQATF